MTRTGFVLSEAARNVYRHPATAIGSLMALALILLLFDIFWVAALSTNQFYSSLLAQLRIEAFIDDTVPDSSLSILSHNIEALDGVEKVDFVSKDQARQELARLTGTDLLAGYDTLNPLPRSFIITLKPAAVTTAAMMRIEQSLATLDGVEDVLWSRDWLTKAESTRRVVSNVGVVIGSLILLTAVISSANSIRLMTRARGLGFHQMLLLGAGRFFVAAPFLLEGLVIAGASALMSWILVWYFHSEIEFSQFPLQLPKGMYIAGFCVAIALLGGVSGFLGIRKQLR